MNQSRGEKIFGSNLKKYPYFIKHLKKFYKQET